MITCSRHPFPEECPWEAGPEDHIQVDLADPNGTIEAVAEPAAAEGRAAGGAGEQRRHLAEGRGRGAARHPDHRPQTWGHVFHVNFFATVVLARGLIAELAAAKGAIVNVTSIAGARVHPFAGAAYATSKAALAALTREMAHDLGPMGIRVNAIAPGEIETEILSPGTEELRGPSRSRRLGEPEEVARRSPISAPPESSYVSGVEIEISGQHVDALRPLTATKRRRGETIRASPRSCERTVAVPGAGCAGGRGVAQPAPASAGRAGVARRGGRAAPVVPDSRSMPAARDAGARNRITGAGARGRGGRPTPAVANSRRSFNNPRLCFAERYGQLRKILSCVTTRNG